MKVLLIEDEQPAAKQLTKMLRHYDPNIVIIDVLESVEASVLWLKNFPAPDAIFMDIQIADGLSFDIFSQVEVTAPVIFCTAFDQYAIKAFKVNAIDYLLKPFDEAELATAMSRLEHRQNPMLDHNVLQTMLAQIQTPKTYRARFLVKTGQSLITIEANEIAYFYSENSICQIVTHLGKKYILENTLDELEHILAPDVFFRISRKQIIAVQAVSKIHTHFNGRLKLDLVPTFKEDVFVSRERVSEFKNWLGG
jgi:DNA-binding LytR/AlgR family response regulator